MPAELQIAFRHMDSSDAAAAQIRQRAAELEQFSDRISHIRVVVEANDRHHHQGSLYRVRINLTLPGRDVTVDREPGRNHAHEDPHVAIRDAFDAVRRRLQDHMRRMDGDTKTHAEPLIGRVASIFAERDYLFLTAADGQDVYVHRNSVRGGGFDRLRVGDRVRYVMDETEGEKGAQASAVFPPDGGS